MADDPTMDINPFQTVQTVTEMIQAVTDVSAIVKSEPVLSNLEDTKILSSVINAENTYNVTDISIDETIPTEKKEEEKGVHQFSLSDHVNSFTDYPLHPSAVVFTASNFTTNNPLDNLKDFSNWNTSDIHDFHLNHENDIEGNEFTYFDQLAVESEHSSNTIAHTILPNATLPHEDFDSEHLTYNVTVSTASSFSEEVTRVWITPTLLSSTAQYEDQAEEEEMNSTPKYFTNGVNPSKELKLTNNQESLDHVTDDQVATPFRDDPSLTHYRTVYHDIMEPLKHETQTTPPQTTPPPMDVTKTNQFTPGLLSVEEVHIQESENRDDTGTFNDHFDLVTTDIGHKFDHADFGIESSSQLSTNNTDHITQVYNSDLYEVVTSQIDSESDFYLDDQEDLTVYEYDNVNSDYLDVVINTNSTDDDVILETEDINEKYATFLDNLHQKYKESSDNPDSNRDHSPKLFEDSLSILVENKLDLPKLFDKGLPKHQHIETLEDEHQPLETSQKGYDPKEKDVAHPLISLMKIEPHAMKLLVKPRKFEPDTMVRLMYERVPRNKPALQRHLDDPVIEYVHVYRLDQEHYLTNLPMGKYIVCGEAQINGEVFQANCFETSIDRLDNNMLQGGVIAVIAVALLIVFCVIVYAIYHRLVLSKRKDIERQ